MLQRLGTAAASCDALRRRHAGADRARHAGAAETAIAERILGEILLVIVLGEVELRRVEDLGRDRAIALAGQRLAKHRLRVFGGLLLRRRGRVNAGAILWADVV